VPQSYYMDAWLMVSPNWQDVINHIM